MGLIAAVTIQVWKFENDKSHFESWHSIVGAVANIAMLGVAFAGYNEFTRPSKRPMWKYHRTGGVVTVSLMHATIVLGLSKAGTVALLSSDIVYYASVTAASLIWFGNVVQVSLFQ